MSIRHFTREEIYPVLVECDKSHVSVDIDLSDEEWKEFLDIESRYWNFQEKLWDIWELQKKEGK